MRNEAKFGLGLRDELSVGGKLRLRNEVTLGLLAFFLQTSQIGEGFPEGAVVGRAIAEKERESLFIHAVFGEAVILKPKRALSEPVGLGHLLDE